MPVKKRPTRQLPSIENMFEWEASRRSKEENRMEWLYLESLRLAELTPKEQANRACDLLGVKNGAHHWLIGKGPRPAVWRFRLKSSFVKRGNAVLPVKDGEGGTALTVRVWDPTRCQHSWDPELPEAVLLSEFRRAIKAEKKVLGRIRAQGGGRPRSADRMAEALRAYEDRKCNGRNLSVREIGERAKTFGPIPVNVHGTAEEVAVCEDRGQKLIAHAKHMIDTAKAGRQHWMKTFPVQ